MAPFVVLIFLRAILITACLETRPSPLLEDEIVPLLSFCEETVTPLFYLCYLLAMATQ